MKYLDKPLKRYIDDLSGRLPAPGGGSASALTGSVGAGLLIMVCHFTETHELKGRKKLAMSRIKRHLIKLQRGLKVQVDEDIVQYLKLSRLLKLPKSDKNRIRLVQAGLKKATRPPYEVCELAHEAMDVGALLLEDGNKNLISDLGSGFAMLESAYTSAKLNVFINLKYIKDKYFVKDFIEKLNVMDKDVKRLRNMVVTKVRGQLKRTLV
jgi:formiminotetrahydrofolate cyclodeaminase